MDDTNDAYEFLVFLKDGDIIEFELTKEEAERISQTGLRWNPNDDFYKFISLHGAINEINPAEIVRTWLSTEPNPLDKEG